ncbi:DUF1674 domain-containing protein [Caulobacter sp. 17J80-11]|uniref:DUF1674 domain-containing protein n=1 Tax=Caulobacter sp. 17J80-11 TaxID=2763502 RepID=UPI001653D5AD|nr:DUF1674 domain-containing protein [Caulobacter sp. 17J80-11]MBC6982785.1 DUF1674 domain-containing protein [Caulobacter sp. 17J80-11]
MTDTPEPEIAKAEVAEVEGAAPGKTLTPAARRALEEAAARRAAEPAPELPPEDGGPSGLEPTRFNDWERKGLAVDF